MPEASAQAADDPRDRCLPPWLAPTALAALVLIGVSYFVGLGRLPLFDQDEPRYAATARTMLETGDYVRLRFNEQPRWAKPPLIYWLMAASYRLFGVNESAARLPSAVSTLAMLAALVWLGRRAAGVAAGWLAAVIYGSFLQTIVWARIALTDATLTLFIAVAALALFIAGEAPPDRKRGWYLLAAAAMGLGFNTKGPMAVAVPVGVAVVYLVTQRRLLGELRAARVWEPLLLFLLVGSPWYILAYRAEGAEFLRTFFLGENIERFAGPKGRELWRIFYFVPFVLSMTFPFSALIPAMIRRGWPRRQQEDAHGGPESRLANLQTYLLLWSGLVIVGFSLSSAKNPQYVMSAYPALALFCGLFFAGHLGGREPVRDADERAAVVLMVLLGAILVAACWALADTKLLSSYAHEFGGHPSAQSRVIALGLAAAIGVGTLAAAIAWLLRRRAAALWLMVLTAWGVGLGGMLTLGPEIASYRQRPLKEISLQAKAIVPPGSRILQYGVRSSAVVFYAERTTAVYGPRQLDKVQAALRGDPGACVLTTHGLAREAFGGRLHPRAQEGDLVLLAQMEPDVRRGAAR